MAKKDKRPAFWLYFKDLITDQELAKASWQTKGIWVWMFCNMYPAVNRGEISGTMDELRRIVSFSDSEFYQFINEAIRYDFADIMDESGEKIVTAFCDRAVSNNTFFIIRNRRMWREDNKRSANRQRQKRFRSKGGGSAKNWSYIISVILERDEHKCAYCPGLATTVDHIYPKSRGGTEQNSNLCGCCKKCNTKKSKRTPEEAGMSFRDDFNRENLLSNHEITPPSTYPLDLSNDKSENRHYSNKIQGYVSEVDKLCRSISAMKQKRSRFNPFAWVQQWANKGGHPQAMVDILKAMAKNWQLIKSPWPYADKAMAAKSGKYHESQHVKESHKFKNLWIKDPKVKELIGGMFDG